MAAKLFDSTNGYWRYKGEPFLVTTAWYVFHRYLADPKEIFLLDELKAAGFTTADLWFTGANLWDGRDWNFSSHDEYLSRAGAKGLKVPLTIDFTASRFARGTVLEHQWKTVTEEGEEILLDKEGLYRHDHLKDLDPGDPRLLEVRPGQKIGDPYVFQNLPILDPTYLDILKDFLQAIVLHYRDNPDVIYYNLMGEVWGFKPYYKHRRGMIEVGYDEITRAAFRVWLKRRLSLDALESRWGLVQEFMSWDRVEPPAKLRRTDFAGRELRKWNTAWWDWHEFKRQSTTLFMRKVTNWIKEMDDRPVIDEYNTSMPGYHDGWNRELPWNALVGAVGSAEGGAGGGLDHLGVQAFEAEYDRQLFYIAISRGASPPPHQLNEIAGRPRDFILKSKISSDDRDLDPACYLRRVTWLCQAMGCTGMNVWNLKGGAIGMIDDDGNKAENYEEILALNDQFRRCSARLSASIPFEPSIGILLLEETTFNEPGLGADIARNILYELAVHQFGSEAAVITETELENGAVNHYRLVLAPRVPYATDENAKRLAEYVHRGGFLYLGPESGRFDQCGNEYGDGMNEAMRALSGVLPVRVHPKEFMAHDMAFKTDFGVIKAGFNIVGDYAENLRLDGESAAVIAEYGWQAALPLITTNRFGQGRCVYSGVSLNRNCRFLTQMVRSLVALAGLAPLVEVTGRDSAAGGSVPGEARGVIAGLRRRDDGCLLILVEIADRHHALAISFNPDRLNLLREGGLPVRLEDCLGNEAVSLGAGPGWTAEIDLPPGQARVLNLSIGPA